MLNALFFVLGFLCGLIFVIGLFAGVLYRVAKTAAKAKKSGEQKLAIMVPTIKPELN